VIHSEVSIMVKVKVLAKFHRMVPAEGGGETKQWFEINQLVDVSQEDADLWVSHGLVEIVE